jgi:predicted dienelactone hydrolase
VRRRVVVGLGLALGLALAPACAGDGTAGGTAGDDDATPTADGAPSGGAVDAAPPGTPDAAPGAPDAGVPPGADPGAPGPYDVKMVDATAGNVQVTVFAPSSDGGQTVAAGSFPLLVLSPGFQMPRAQYASYGQHLASHGIIAVSQDFGGGFAPQHQQLAAQTTAVIDWAVGGAGGALTGHVDADKIGAAGHSLGGKISFLTATTDARIAVIVGWDPVDANTPSVAPELMSQIDAPIVILGETNNASGGFMPCAPAADNFEQYYMAAGSPAVKITVTKADHMDWVDDTGCAFCGFCTAGTADDAWVKQLSRRTTVAAARRYLLGDASMDAYLTGAVIQQDVVAGDVTVVSK